ncbi:MAG: response regulator [Ruminococcus sp.]|nr:response regulator [Ruminococcus sp.]
MTTLSIDDQKDITELMRIMLTNIDRKGTHLTATNLPQALDLLKKNDIQIVFLDIEMPGINGIEAAHTLKENFKKINIIFVTGHPEYSLEAYGVHPSGFLTKPVCESDIVRELNNLRFPINTEKSPLKVQCSPFALFINGKPFEFCRDRTIELFAYLIYKKGAFCTNGELLGILWAGDPNKQGHLRQLVMDMRKCLSEIDSEYIIQKKYGKIGIDIEAVQYEGEPEKIIDEFRWI